MKKKELEQLLRQAYRAGQDSVSCMRVIHAGKGKPSHDCLDEICNHDIEETDTAEDEVVERLLSS